VRACHQLGPAAESRIGTDGRDDGMGLAALDQRARIGGAARRHILRHRFPRQCRLVNEHRAIEDAYVCGYDGSERQGHQVVDDEIGGENRLPCAVAIDRGLKGETAGQGVERRCGPRLLHVAERTVEQQQASHDPRFGVLPRNELQHDGGLEHPGHRAPQLRQRHTNRMTRVVFDRVASRRPLPLGRLLRGQPSHDRVCQINGV